MVNHFITSVLLAAGGLTMKQRGRAYAFVSTALLLALFGSARGADPKIEPVPLDGSPAQAFASHKVRMSAISRHYAVTHPLNPAGGVATEDNTLDLIAHMQAATDDPDFALQGQEQSRILAPRMLRNLNQGHGQVGTSYDEIVGSRKGDYDMALKGLMVIAYRYRHLLTDEDVNFILDSLVPGHLRGAHDPSIEIYRPFFTETAPETENHMLMINSTRYLVNQLLFDRTGDRRFDNNVNGLTGWLLAYMQTIAKHDFLEFNARPYQRLSLHALFNLHEFARDEPVRTGAQILLDYATMKFAISSNRQRRISPFRRLHENTNTLTKLNEILWDGHGGDPLTGFFLAYSGITNPDGNPVDVFPNSWTFNALISGLTPYRPTPAAYILTMKHDAAPYQHRFYHGLRPKLRGTDDQAEGGLEIYYRSPSFLLTAGGAFLNSGYGGDEFTKFKQTAIAQSTTLIPTRVDLKFADLIRFDPYPDQRRAVNNAVHNGFACGANLRPWDKKILSDSSTHAPVFTSHDGRLLLGWKGAGNENLNVGKIFATSLLGVEGVEGVEAKTTLGDTTEEGPGLASHNGRVFLAWKGAGNDNLNLIFSDDGGTTFRGKTILSDTSHHAPVLASHNGRLYLAWTGRGDGNLNIAKVVLIGNTVGGFSIGGIEDKVVLGDTSEQAPALISHNGRLFIAWKGSGNDNLNLLFSEDNGASFKGKATFGDTSHHGPALASHNGRLFLGWTGRGAGNLNVAKVTLIGNTLGAFGIGGLEDKVTIGDTSDRAPGLMSNGGRLFLAWKGSGNDNLNLRVSPDGQFHSDRWFFGDLSRFGFYVAFYRTPPAQPEQLDTHLDTLGLLYAMETGSMSFDRFRRLTLERNGGLPERLKYGARYEFHTADNRRFACWLHPSLAKYDARVGEIGEANLVGDLASLPLAQGPYLSAPGGHDGLVEIRHPGCEEAPVVLDFRNAAAPARRDNVASCPGPWLDRAQALLAFATKLGAAGQVRAEQTALNDRVKILEVLAEADRSRFGQDYASAAITALATAGVDFSVPEVDLRDWLNNREFTPYPAFAEALLQLLERRRLRRPVFIDVIAWNYDHVTGAVSPRKLKDVNVDLLKRAIAEGYATRYGEPVANFEALLH